MNLFNDAIVREAAAQALSVIDLLTVVTSPAGYAAMLPIEPSGLGAAKSAQTIGWVLAFASDSGGSKIYA